MRLPEFIRKRLERWALKTMGSRPPDFIIRPQGRDQTLRWWIIPKNRWFNVYLHKFVLSDEDRALHDHPWLNASILVSGEYIEWVPRGFVGIGDTPNRPYRRRQGYVYFRKPSQAHRVELECAGYALPDSLFPEGEPLYNPVITIFLTGPWVRNWGFLCPQGWRRWQDFCSQEDQGIIGKGCD